MHSANLRTRGNDSEFCKKHGKLVMGAKFLCSKADNHCIRLNEDVISARGWQGWSGRFGTGYPYAIY